MCLLHDADTDDDDDLSDNERTLLQTVCIDELIASGMEQIMDISNSLLTLSSLAPSNPCSFIC